MIPSILCAGVQVAGADETAQDGGAGERAGKAHASRQSPAERLGPGLSSVDNYRWPYIPACRNYRWLHIPVCR